MTAGIRWNTALDPLRAAVATGLDFVHTHIQLFGVELEQELWRARSLVVQAVAALLLTFLAAGFLGFALIVVFWDNHRQLVTVLVAAFFAALAAVAAGVLRRSVAARLRPFASTLELLERDREALRGDR
jgi:uncharacterized membrane protein YqjE